MTTLTVENGALVLSSRYDAGLVAGLKARVPATGRKFDGQRKTWVIDAQYGGVVVDLVKQHLNEKVQLPAIAIASPVEDERVIEVRYVGQTKARDGYDEQTALGFDGREWSVIFPESVLRTWFEGTLKGSSEPTTLYGILGVGRDASDEVIKTAFRRMARQWHPDVCREPDAQEQFIKIKNAYDILSSRRARYDAGLALEESTRGNDKYVQSSFTQNYRSPLRCGFVLVRGVERIGRYFVREIMSWKDITNDHGQTLISSWPMGATRPVEVWA